VIDDVEERLIGALQDLHRLFFASHADSATKLYGGQGPVSVSSYPSRCNLVAALRTAAWNGFTRPRRTRKAASRGTRRPAGPAGGGLRRESSARRLSSSNSAVARSAPRWITSRDRSRCFFLRKRNSVPLEPFASSRAIFAP